MSAVTFDGLVVDAAREAGASILIRGLRDGADFDYEMQMAGMNGPWRRTCRRCSCRPRPPSATSPPRLSARSPAMGGDVSPLRAGGRRQADAQASLRAEALRYPANRSTLLDPLPRRSRPCLLRRLAATAGGPTLDPENTLIMELPTGRVVIELRPDLAPKHVARIKELARKGFYDGTPSIASSTASWRRAATRPAPARAARTCPTSRPSSPTRLSSAARSARRGPTTPIRPTRSSSSVRRRLVPQRPVHGVGRGGRAAWNSSTRSSSGEPARRQPRQDHQDAGRRRRASDAANQDRG